MFAVKKACSWSVMVAESTWDRLVFILYTTQLPDFGRQLGALPNVMAQQYTADNVARGSA
jgi:hypothetical protein